MSSAELNDVISSIDLDSPNVLFPVLLPISDKQFKKDHREILLQGYGTVNVVSQQSDWLKFITVLRN